MKNLKSLVLTFIGMLALIVCASMFTACSQDEYLPEINQAEEFQTDNTIIPETRASSIYLGDGSVYPTSGYPYETTYFFEFSSTSSTISNSQVDVYIVFYAPLGGEYPVIMDKNVSGNSTICTLNRQLTQIGTYGFKFAITYGDIYPDPITFGDMYYVTVNGHSFSTSNTYPWDGYSTGSDTWGYTKGWCTSYVAWKVHEMWGSSFHTGLHNAYQWKDNLTDLGYVCDQNPLPGDIMWYEPGYNGIGSYGHVAFVNSVTSTTITYSQYNGVSSNPNTYNYNTVNRTSLSHKYFIHVQTKK